MHREADGRWRGERPVLSDPLDSPFYTLKEAADVLRVHEMTMYRLCKEGKIKARKIGGQWRIWRAAVKKLMEGST